MELMRQYENLMEKIQQNTATEEEMEQFLKEAEVAYQKEVSDVHSFNHPLESYYYEYYIGKGPVKEVPVNMGYLYRTLAKQYEKERKLRKAETSFNRSYRWNPVDLDTLYCLIELNKKDNELDRVYELTEKCYPFCCSRADLAHYYRNLGFYYLESYEPETAKALYEYSQLFYPTKQAENELAYLEKAMGNKLGSMGIKRMQKVLEEKEIPLQASSKTVGLTYQIGMAALKAGNMNIATDCLAMVYDVTQDEEVKALLSEHKVF